MFVNHKKKICFFTRPDRRRGRVSPRRHRDPDRQSPHCASLMWGRLVRLGRGWAVSPCGVPVRFMVPPRTEVMFSSSCRGWVLRILCRTEVEGLIRVGDDIVEALRHLSRGHTGTAQHDQRQQCHPTDKPHSHLFYLGIFEIRHASKRQHSTGEASL